MEPNDLTRDLLAFIDAAPTPYHAVEETRRRVEEAGYRELEEGSEWHLAPGDRCWVARGGGSILAFEVGARALPEAGFRMIGAHTDSPNLRLRPLPETASEGYKSLRVEPYGGLLLHTWMDRDLSLAGRVEVLVGGRPETRLVRLNGPLLCIPNLAIHLQPELRTSGLQLNPQKHGNPIIGLNNSRDLLDLVTAGLNRDARTPVDAADILSMDLMAFDTQPCALWGPDQEFIAAPRLDNLASCHAALTALTAPTGIDETAGQPSEATRLVVFYDHEEVGSRSSRGAAGPFLEETLERIIAATGSPEQSRASAAQDTARAFSRSMLVSADMAHAVHPNHAEKHEPGHKPVLGSGPVVKTNVNQAYAGDASSTARFLAVCRKANVLPQQFGARSDQGCGSTIGPISAAQTGIATVDVGNPMLGMHSCRETAASADVEPMIRVLSHFLNDE